MAYLSAEELLAGSSLSFDLEIPPHVINPATSDDTSQPAMKVKLKPLSMSAVQRILKAAKDDNGLMSALMIKEALIEPVLTYEAVMKLNSGLVRFVLNEVQRISGLQTTEDELTDAVQKPMAKACYILAREFGWSPQQVSELTLGQVLMYVEMLRQNELEKQEAC